MKHTLRLLLLLILTLTGCAGFKVLNCPNGEPVTVVKDISKAYPVYAAAYDFNLKAVIKATEEVNVDASAELKKKIEKLRDDLNQESSRVQMLLQTALMGLQTTPCDIYARKRFSDVLARINENSLKLSEIDKILSQKGVAPLPMAQAEALGRFAEDYKPVQ